MSECGRCDCELPTDPDDYRIIGRDSLGVFARHWTTEDCVNALLKKTHELRRLAEWQPGDAAPRDGSEIEVRSSDGALSHGRYQQIFGGWTIDSWTWGDRNSLPAGCVWRPIPPLPKEKL